MRIYRVRDDKGITWATAGADDAPLRRLQGDTFGEWELTEKPIGEHLVLAPLEPAVIFAVGQNYRAHAAEMKSAVSAFPTIFMKNPSAVHDPGVPIQLPRALRSDKVDYEGELAVVIGRTCRNATAETALNYVLGYTIANDVSARDWQREWGGGQFCRGKSFDTFCPLGPCIVTGEELGDPGQLRIRTRVNGEERQNGSTSDLITSVPELIAFLSGSTTLPAGTVILTGTPSGVGAGFDPPRYLTPGDQIAIEIEGIGRLENAVREEVL